MKFLLKMTFGEDVLVCLDLFSMFCDDFGRRSMFLMGISRGNTLRSCQITGGVEPLHVRIYYHILVGGLDHFFVFPYIGNNYLN